MQTTNEQPWLVICDECRQPMRTTNSLQESYEGGLCDSCREEVKRVLERLANRKGA